MREAEKQRARQVEASHAVGLQAVGLLTHFTVAKLPAQVSHRHAANGFVWLQRQGTMF